jgi:hypothetical protein
MLPGGAVGVIVGYATCRHREDGTVYDVGKA